MIPGQGGDLQTVFGKALHEGGEGGKAGIFRVENAEFLAAVFRSVPRGAFAAVCSKAGDPGEGAWIANRADEAVRKLPDQHNNFAGWHRGVGL